MTAQRGRRSISQYDAFTRDALRFLKSPIDLETTDFAQVEIVKRLADSKYSNSASPLGMAACEVLDNALCQLLTLELSGMPGPFPNYVALIRNGLRQSEAARALGRSPSHVSRAYAPRLAHLVALKIRAMSRDIRIGGQAASDRPGISLVRSHALPGRAP